VNVSTLQSSESGTPAGQPLAARLDAAMAAEQRVRMVKSQLQTVGLFNLDLIHAFENTPRERHVPAELSGLAYADAALEVVPGRFLLEPMALALLFERGGLNASDRVLVVGAATGYSAAVAASCGAVVTALEDNAALLPMLHAASEAAGYTVAEGPLAEGWAAGAPYSLILFEGAIEHIPAVIAAQLAPAGRVAAVMRVAGVGHAVAGPLVTGRVTSPPFLEVAARPLPGFARPRAFAF
jgi:protein-L-isoaspartate(D-aspartate) O-methyltransferase